MAIDSVWCPVLQTHVTRLSDLEGGGVIVICYEYDRATRLCRMKQAALKGGPLSQLVARTSEHALTDATVSCAIA